MQERIASKINFDCVKEDSKQSSSETCNIKPDFCGETEVSHTKEFSIISQCHVHSQEKTLR